MQIVSAISDHFGEALVRARFTEYVQRFVRLAARYEEEYLGSTKIGYPSSSVSFDSEGHCQLGSGLIFSDESAVVKELSANANRIEGWRRTKMYQHYSLVCLLSQPFVVRDVNRVLSEKDFQTSVATKPIQGFDLYHQLVRLKTAKFMADAETETIMRMFVENVRSYEQVVEVSMATLYI